jgi:hypothetical protein
VFQSAPVVNTAERFSHTVYPFFTATLIVGLLSMALIQILKDLVPVRRWFQKYWVRQWLLERTPFWKSDLDPEQRANSDARKAEWDLIQLAMDGDSNSFFNLPIEQLCGQLNAAAQSVLEHPEEHATLLYYLASKAEPRDVSTVIECSEKYREQSGTKLEGSDRSTFAYCVDARNRVAHHIQRAIDALQLSAGNRWKLWIQIFSIGLSGLIASVALSLFGEVGGAWRRVETTVAVAILGGFLAPIARDLIAGLQSFRK